VLTLAWIHVFPADSNQPIYEERVWIPYFNNDYSKRFDDDFGAVFPAYAPEPKP
jgi:hypothetical protein